MKLTYDFDEDFFRLMVSEEFEKADARVDEIEDEIDGFLSGAKTLYLGNGATIHAFRREAAKASSCCATTKECALTVSMRNFPSGQDAISARERTSVNSLIFMG